MLLLSLLPKNPNSSLSSWFRIIPGLKDLLSIRDQNDFELVVDSRMAKAIDRLERNANQFKSLGEDALTAILGGYIECPGIIVEQESHSNGHTDLKISLNSIQNNYYRLAEAKIYRGPAYHLKGMTQLISLYSTGSNPSAFMISYFVTGQITSGVTAIRNYLDYHKPLNQNGSTVPHPNNAFYSDHVHRSGNVILIKHFNINLN